VFVLLKAVCFIYSTSMSFTELPSIENKTTFTAGKQYQHNHMNMSKIHPIQKFLM